MRVFVTGAAGFIGRAVVQELLENGHQVLGLARNEKSATIIRNAGAEPYQGDLEDLESLARGAQAADGVIHLAFIHDWSDYARGTTADKAALEAMGKALAGTGKPLVVASGTLMLQKGSLADEDSPIDCSTPLSARSQSEQLVRSMSEGGDVRGIVVRLSPTVHGKEDWAFMPMFIGLARKNGYAAYVGDGSARWPAVHRPDAAVLLRLALEKGVAGATYHAIAEEGVLVKDFIGVIGTQLGLPVKSLTQEEANNALGSVAALISTDNPTSSQRTQRELNWHPTGVGLLEDLEKNYFS